MTKFAYPILAIVSFAFTLTPAMANHGGKHAKKPCAAVHHACMKAGKKKKAAKECVDTIKGGGTVAGVTVSPEDLKACQGGA